MGKEKLYTALKGTIVLYKRGAIPTEKVWNVIFETIKFGDERSIKFLPEMLKEIYRRDEDFYNKERDKLFNLIQVAIHKKHSPSAEGTLEEIMTHLQDPTKIKVARKENKKPRYINNPYASYQRT